MKLVPSFSVVFLAGGTGVRMGSAIPKQYLAAGQKSLALYSFEVFIAMPELREMIVVCDPQYDALFRHSVPSDHIPLRFARPGFRRQDSAFNGIQLLQDNPLVCIHDAVRPLIDASIVRRVVQAADDWEAAVVGVRTKSTIKICDDAQFVVGTPDRAALWEVQTPQVVRLSLLKEAFAHVRELGVSVTDDVSLVEALGRPVKMVEGSYANIKVTTPEDLAIVESLLHAVL